MNEWPCFDGPNDGGWIWTELSPRAGEMFQDFRGHRYVFSERFSKWIYVGVFAEAEGVRFRGQARTADV
jgi:hypothetical protein